jgi:hypothetical protein
MTIEMKIYLHIFQLMMLHPIKLFLKMVCYALPLLVIDFTYNLLNIVSLKNFNSQ